MIMANGQISWPAMQAGYPARRASLWRLVGVARRQSLQSQQPAQGAMWGRPLGIQLAQPGAAAEQGLSTARPGRRLRRTDRAWRWVNPQLSTLGRVQVRPLLRFGASRSGGFLGTPGNFHWDSIHR